MNYPKVEIYEEDLLMQKVPVFEYEPLYSSRDARQGFLASEVQFYKNLVLYMKNLLSSFHAERESVIMWNDEIMNFVKEKQAEFYNLKDTHLARDLPWGLEDENSFLILGEILNHYIREVLQEVALYNLA